MTDTSGAKGAGMNAPKKDHALAGWAGLTPKSANCGYGTDNGNESGDGGAKPKGNAPDTVVNTPLGKPF